MDRVDKHLVGHCMFSRRRLPVRASRAKDGARMGERNPPECV
jgi:hypothetical protein